MVIARVRFAGLTRIFTKACIGKRFGISQTVWPHLAHPDMPVNVHTLLLRLLGHPPTSRSTPGRNNGIARVIIFAVTHRLLEILKNSPPRTNIIIVDMLREATNFIGYKDSL